MLGLPSALASRSSGADALFLANPCCWAGLSGLILSKLVDLGLGLSMEEPGGCWGEAGRGGGEYGRVSIWGPSGSSPSLVLVGAGGLGLAGPLAPAPWGAGSGPVQAQWRSGWGPVGAQQGCGLGPVGAPWGSRLGGVGSSHPRAAVRVWYWCPRALGGVQRGTPGVWAGAGPGVAGWVGSWHPGAVGWICSGHPGAPGRVGSGLAPRGCGWGPVLAPGAPAQV